VLTGWLSGWLLSGCAYYHPVTPPPTDLAALPDGIRRNVEVGSLVRLKTSSGQWTAGKVLSLTETQIVVRILEAGAFEGRTFEIASIEDMKVKTWRTSDTIIFTGMGVGAYFLFRLVMTGIAFGRFAGD
jgi:hypothetical protein